MHSLNSTGCTYCSHTGFRERVGVYEAPEVTDEIGQLLVQRATPNELRDLAKQQGMRTMGDEAARLIADDITTIDEVICNVFVS